MDDPCDSRDHGYQPQPAGVSNAHRYSQPIEDKGEPQQDVREALQGILGPPQRLGSGEGGCLLLCGGACPGIHSPLEGYAVYGL
jgi:hypothetical protein